MFLLFLQRAIRFSTVFLFGSTGETLTEKSGNLNLGTPGIMCMGGAGAVLGTEAYFSAEAGQIRRDLRQWGRTLRSPSRLPAIRTGSKRSSCHTA